MTPGPERTVNVCVLTVPSSMVFASATEAMVKKVNDMTRAATNTESNFFIFVPPSTKYITHGRGKPFLERRKNMKKRRILYEVKKRAFSFPHQEKLFALLEEHLDQITFVKD